MNTVDDQSLGAGNKAPVNLTPPQERWWWHDLAGRIAGQARAIADGGVAPGDVARLAADVGTLVRTEHYRRGGGPS